ncbi:prepilin-type N-terminal cleavage/methylation domain-containing protein [Bosea sp. (in: a-proteobacteria)]|uniref:type II secretion system protein n=1 Tax=Bosea sp. (in: a-proteobacteria) TaxID=1871050 RepID=UPI0012085D11|nr:prepilin-type N-terminal cleavage/methylation domain-containing protein [Bosea sp. (in: a-proteobacteria)]TAJ28466.1 MAG: prepilin-type N-terminal cleavage/methylation domain-containing protein [Bosea sp. (in: a-proteobacteria)]
MSDAGYTLTETLTALAIVGMAVGGLSAGVAMVGKTQAAVTSTVADVQAVQSAQIGIQRLFEGQGPFRSHEPQRLSGDGRGMHFICGRETVCKIEIDEAAALLKLRVDAGGRVRSLALRQPGPARFVYQGSLGPSSAWPPVGVERQVLRSVSLVRGEHDPTPLIEVQVWREQPQTCAFDVVLQDCR